MADQLTLFGESSNQNHFTSELWGLLTFVPTGSSSWSDNCRHCPLWMHKGEQTPDDECLRASCSHEDRADGRDGYFSIHNMLSNRLCDKL